MALFNLGKQSIPTPEESFNSLLGIEEKTKITEISIDLLDEIKDQPFKLNPDKVEQIAQSVDRVGVLEPVIVRPKKNGRYDIIAGRHRARAAKLCNLSTVPCITKDVSKDIASLILLSTNTDRNNEYAPSELAAAYKQQAELLRKLGSNTPSIAKIAENNNTNRKKIQRYIRLTYLIPSLLKLVDKKDIPFMAGVSLSYLNADAQQQLFGAMLTHGYVISIDTADRIKRVYEDTGKLLPEAIDNIFNPNEDTAKSERAGTNCPPLKAEKKEAVDKMSESKQKENLHISPATEKSEPDPPLDFGMDLNIIKEAIKHYYDIPSVYIFYLFSVPTTKQAIKNILKPVHGFSSSTVIFSDNSSGSVHAYSTYLEIMYKRKKSKKIPYAYIDGCIRNMIKTGEWIESKEAIALLLEQFKKLGG